jgi:hypothetical protein
MTHINSSLLLKLKQNLGVGKSRVYEMIEDKVAETHLDRHLAAIVLASENGINISKFSTSEELSIIRGVSQPPSSLQILSKPTKSARRIVKTEEPIILDLSFVSSNELIDILKRDIVELNIARSQGMDKTAKTCMVLSGSIAEALLLDVLMQNKKAAFAKASLLPKKPSLNLEEWDLYDMVTVATQLALLPDDTSTGATQLRKWRNLIHPGRELKEKRSKRIKPTMARARNSISFLQFLAEELIR